METNSTPSIQKLILEAGARPLAPDVPVDELSARLSAIRTEMEVDQLDAIVLTDLKNIRYLTDFHSFSSYFNSRPFFALVTAADLLLFGAAYEQAYVDAKPRSFSALYYDGYLEQGAGLVADTIRSTFKGKTPRIGIDYGEEMNGRGSMLLVDALRELSTGGELKSASPTVWRVRHIKTPFEAELKRTAFAICNEAFDQAIAQAHIGITEYELWRIMQAQTFLNGADSGDPFPVIFSKGDFMYGRPPSNRRLEPGHYVWSDFRATYGGYPADRNRIARAGEPSAWELETYTAVRELTLELCHSIRPGMTCSEFYEATMRKWAPFLVGNKFALHTPGSKSARFGHGGGLDVVETPSLGAFDNTVIRPGMILHVEPKLERDGAVFQFEEVIYLREDGIEFVTPLCPEIMPVIR
ncbi:Xaa-Pro peptidase family protein [Caballeronia sp. GACF5]|uniref:M24 family metallopeptidase n=1 Tax=Caballeronia sp. GACF5 TaxID=2921746 RepID=UPI0020288DA2|nr:Xaa-Pro peptidase family protein [Caballeronia sp. GACF5]